MDSWRKHLRRSASAANVYDVPPSARSVRLHANEAGEPWPPDVVDDVLADLRQLELNRYPDTSARGLRALIAARLGCDAERVVIGNGSAEIIGLFYALLCGAAEPTLVVPVPAFAMFANSGHAFGYDVRQVPLTRDLQLDVPAMRRALRGATLCIIARPNNPTGSLYPRAEIDALVAEFPETIFIIDEAYAAYAPGCSLFDVHAPSNRVHVGSLSKNGLAALRVGYCAADPALALELDRVRMPYNVPQPSLLLAEAMLSRHADLLDASIQAAVDRREDMREILGRLPGATVLPSHANMVLVCFEDRDRAVQTERALLQRDVQVRHVSDEAGFREVGLRGVLRASVGGEREIELLAEAVADITAAHPTAGELGVPLASAGAGR